jgi:hypothetical protein
MDFTCQTENVWNAVEVAKHAQLAKKTLASHASPTHSYHHPTLASDAILHAWLARMLITLISAQAAGMDFTWMATLAPRDAPRTVSHVPILPLAPNAFRVTRLSKEMQVSFVHLAWLPAEHVLKENPQLAWAVVMDFTSLTLHACLALRTVPNVLLPDALHAHQVSSWLLNRHAPSIAFCHVLPVQWLTLKNVKAALLATHLMMLIRDVLRSEHAMEVALSAPWGTVWTTDRVWPVRKKTVNLVMLLIWVCVTVANLDFSWMLLALAILALLNAELAWQALGARFAQRDLLWKRMQLQLQMVWIAWSAMLLA